MTWRTLGGDLGRSRGGKCPGGTSITRAPDLKGSGGPPSHLAGGAGQKDPVALGTRDVPARRARSSGSERGDRRSRDLIKP